MKKWQTFSQNTHRNTDWSSSRKKNEYSRRGEPVAKVVPNLAEFDGLNGELEESLDGVETTTVSAERKKPKMIQVRFFLVEISSKTQKQWVGELPRTEVHRELEIWSTAAAMFYGKRTRWRRFLTETSQFLSLLSLFAQTMMTIDRWWGIKWHVSYLSRWYFNFLQLTFHKQLPGCNYFIHLLF